MKKICLNCTTEYETKQSNSKYCSIKCGISYRKIKTTRNLRIIRWAKKMKAIDILGGKCNCCSDDSLYHLTFHHLDSPDKDYELSDIWHYSWDNIEKEIKKCILLCDNCHRELHFKEKNQRDNKKLLIEYRNNVCEICGYSKCNASLAFHHKDDKNFNISDIGLRLHTLDDLTENILNELENCKLLCTNCHRDQHTNISDIFDEAIIKKNNLVVKNKVDRTLVKQLYINGINPYQISKIIGCSHNTIRGIVKKFIIPLSIEY